MYSVEIAEYLWRRGYTLESEEVLFITNMDFHPQIRTVTFNPGTGWYEMVDDKDDKFCFYALSYGEKRLVK